MVKRIREEKNAPPPERQPVYAAENDGLTLSLHGFADSLGWEPGLIDLWTRRLAAGGELVIGGRRYTARNDGRIYSRAEPEKAKTSSLLRRWILSFQKRFG